MLLVFLVNVGTFNDVVSYLVLSASNEYYSCWGRSSVCSSSSATWRSNIHGETVGRVFIRPDLVQQRCMLRCVS
jgi:hypothetical protein